LEILNIHGAKGYGIGTVNGNDEGIRGWMKVWSPSLAQFGFARIQYLYDLVWNFLEHDLAENEEADMTLQIALFE
jgi:hypothetical protein